MKLDEHRQPGDVEWIGGEPVPVVLETGQEVGDAYDPGDVKPEECRQAGLCRVRRASTVVSNEAYRRAAQDRREQDHLEGAGVQGQ